MKKFFISVLALGLLAGFMLPIGGTHDYNTPPDEVVNNYWELHQLGEIEEANKLLAEDDIKLINEKDNSKIKIRINNQTENIGDFEKILLENLEIEATNYEEIENRKRYALFGTKGALADVKVTKPNFEEVFDKFISEGQEELISIKNNGASNKEIKQKAEEILENLLEESPKVTHQEQVILRLVEIRSSGRMEGWQVADWNFEAINARIDSINKKMDNEFSL
ncbi:hypothetical protein [Natranaerofaba carboxydovora]|uniref:hypothetical protein n=1 Tax=Natranaerofaba carboxydovora TaxID=2742683 RepID=UPI001F13AD5B|nr:hypothetical protein [Natranaerofaba carboxydovora]UMZ74606.1 hypothetical protein ACONDI_02203 [Natranaerofaba carboxydovora]